MKRGQSYVFDSHAILTYLQNEPGADKVKRLLDKVSARKAIGLMSTVNLCEVQYVVMRRTDRHSARVVSETIRNWGIEILPVDGEVAFRAATMKAGGGLSLGDCFCAAVAEEHGSVLVTGDPELKTIEALTIAWIE